MNETKFNDFRHIKKTRKPHKCVMCCREIPAGHKAHNYVGIGAGDFQDWYACDFCYENIIIPKVRHSDSEYVIRTSDFYEYITEHHLLCPECGKTGIALYDCKISDDDEETIMCWCNHCGHRYKIHIPFECK